MAGARGEAIVTVDGQEYRLLFTNRALADVEARLGRSILAIARDAQGMGLGIADVAQLARCGLEAARRDTGVLKQVSLSEAYDLMDAIGFTGLMLAVVEALGEIITYSPNKEEGDDEAAPPV